LGDNVDGFIYRIGANTNILGRPPKFFKSSDLGNAGCRFGSVYAVREEDARSISETAGTAAGFKGIVWSSRLWADFDNEESANQAKAYLEKEGYDHTVYTTGNRGCHIGIARASNPSHVLPLQDKSWAKENLRGCDLSLYWHLHLIRLPGALHESTGLPKRLLYSRPGRVLTLPAYTPSEYVPAQQPLPPAREGSIFQKWSVVSNLTSDGGSRHHQLVRLAKALKEDCGVTYEESLWMVSEVNKGFEEPKGIDEVTRIVKWTYGG
jgi:hypothetical protein